MERVLGFQGVHPAKMLNTDTDCLSSKRVQPIVDLRQALNSLFLVLLFCSLSMAISESVRADSEVRNDTESTITFVFFVEVQDGQAEKLEDFFMKTADNALREEPGTLDYSWAFNEDKSEVLVYERYADEEAYLAHIQNTDTTGLDGVAKITNTFVAGKLSPEIATRQRESGARLFKSMDGLSR